MKSVHYYFSFQNFMIIPEGVEELEDCSFVEESW